VYQRTLTTEHSLIHMQPAQKLASGTYTLKLITKDKVYTSSFVVD